MLKLTTSANGSLRYFTATGIAIYQKMSWFFHMYNTLDWQESSKLRNLLTSYAKMREDVLKISVICDISNEIDRTSLIAINSGPRDNHTKYL